MSATADRLTDRAATPGFLGLHSRRRGTAALSAAQPPPRPISTNVTSPRRMPSRDSLRLFGGGRVTEQAATIQLLSGARAARLSGATSARMEDLDGRVADVGVGGGVLSSACNGLRPQRTGPQSVYRMWAHATETGRLPPEQA